MSKGICKKTMHNKGRKNLHKYLMQASSADDVINTHAYGKVARVHKPIPTRKHLSSGHGGGAVAGYRDSMVGSVAQYHDKTPIHSKKHDAHVDANQSHDIVGNRPRSGTHDAPKKDHGSSERRHHFIEPPKRGFNRFD